MPSVERVISWIICETQPVHSKNFTIFRLRHAQVRKDTRLSPLSCTASDGKLGGAWEWGLWKVWQTKTWLNSIKIVTMLVLFKSCRRTPRRSNIYIIHHSSNYMYVCNMDRSRYHCTSTQFHSCWAAIDSIPTQPHSQAPPGSPFLVVQKSRRSAELK